MSKREKMIRDNLGLVYSAASKKSWPLDFNDRVSVGCESLINAVDTYDPNRGTPFSSHFYRKYYSDLIDANRLNHNPRNIVSMDTPLPNADGEERFTLHDLIAADNIPAIDSIISEETSALLWKTIDNLPHRWKTLLTMRYIDDCLPQREVAKKFGKSKSWVLREERRALACCRRAMEC